MSTATHHAASVHLAPPARRAMAGCSLVVALSTLSSLLVAGCGGGGTDDAAVPQAQEVAQSVAVTVTAAPATVRLEGCVVDAQWMAAAGVAVHARTADGRAVGSGYTDSRGVFVLSVPARSTVVVGAVEDAQGGLAVSTGSGPVSVAACLMGSL